MELKTIAVPRVPVRYIEGGRGDPLVFLHGAGGITAADPFLELLATKFHVFAPLLPGYGDSDEAPDIRDMLDFTLHTWDVVAALGLRDPLLVGHSMGGMIAAEMAAVQPNDVTRLVLIGPAGLWDDAQPVADIFALLPYEMPKVLFHDPAAGETIMTAGRSLEDTEFLKAFLVTNARQLGMAGRILFPVPERGLSTRLYRITARTLLVWGASDRLVPPTYAHAFKQGIAGARLVSVPEAGHMVILEKPRHVLEAIAEFI